jgi:hypothetical protein
MATSSTNVMNKQRKTRELNLCLFMPTIGRTHKL